MNETIETEAKKIKDTHTKTHRQRNDKEEGKNEFTERYV